MDQPPHTTVDLLIVGGGINGAGIARDAAGRGFSVLLCEQDDLASHTSSASTKMIHGGLRYLEHHEFGLVRKALIEREVLMRAAPHLIRPLHVIMPHEGHQRPAWLIRCGLFLYDHLARRELLPASAAVNLRRHEAGAPLHTRYRRGFRYSDARTDDARLVVINAVDAAERGARILTRCRLEHAERDGLYWHARLRRADGTALTVAARALVNATGPWAAGLLGQLRGGTAQALRLVKGSHIIVPRLYDHQYAYLFQHIDNRVVFVLPYERDYTLIGTTEVDYAGDPADPRIAPAEVAYLCEVASHYFATPVEPGAVVHTYAGVRALLEGHAATASALSRDYRLLYDRAGAPLLSVFGGKITTFRRLAEEAVDMLAGTLGNTWPAWTADACLPGGDLHGNRPSNPSAREFERYVATLQAQYGWLPPALVARYAGAYGSRTHRLLRGRASLAEMGDEVLPGLYAAEIDYLKNNEWAATADDILWRRTKLGLRLPTHAAATLSDWLAAANTTETST